jgi:salicylate hydroxylase
MSVKSAAIIGAGVAGLVAALSLARRGIFSDVFEQAPQLTEVGAGLQISPNAAKILGELGVLPALRSAWREPDEIGLASGLSLRPLAAVPSGAFAIDRWGAPYGVLHRATLQRVLLDAVAANAMCRLHLGCRIEAATPQSIAAITKTAPDLIVGADGVWSKVRNQVPDSPRPHFSGNIAWRFTLANDSAPAFLDRFQVTAFLGPKTHLVCYPLKEIDGFNIVAIGTGTSAGETWATDASQQQRRVLLEQFSGWHSGIRTMLAEASNPNFWPLYEAGPGRWHNGRDTVLIGDAAHAMMPFAAQGAAMAIEDAFELAGLVTALPLPAALVAFEAMRAPRVAKVRNRGAFNKFAYHARGPFRLGRNLVLKLRPPQALAADLDWLYGYQAKG